MKPSQTLAACVLFLCVVALLNQCSSPYLHVEDYPCSFLSIQETRRVERINIAKEPKRIQPTDLKGWQFSNCSLWKSGKGMRVNISGSDPELWLKLPENPQYKYLRFLK